MAMDRRTFLKILAACSVTGCTSWSGGEKLPFPELEAAGSPGELGHAHGSAFRTTIRANLDFYLHWLGEFGGASREHLLERARGYVPVLGQQLPQMLEEMEAIATGAGLRLDEVMLINARTDILAQLQAESSAMAQPACTALALRGVARGAPALALAQNWDWDPKMAEAPVVLRLEPADGPSLVTLVEAGMVGKIGFNEHRLGVCLNFLSHTSDAPPETFGVPIHCLLRAVLGCSSIAEAADMVTQAPRCASANFMLAQDNGSGGRVLDLEIAPTQVAQVPGEGASVVHTNHYLDPKMAEGCTSGRGPSTMKRQARAEQLAARFAAEIPDPVRRAQRVLESRADLPYPISRFHNPDVDSSTLAGIVMDLTHNRFILTRGAPHMSEWVERPGV